MSTVLVALSGGIDSAVTAMLLKQQGYDVKGVHFIFYDAKDSFAKVQEVNTIANKLGIPLDIINLEVDFKDSVINYFVKEYSAGRTPCPCSFCNQNLKFKALYQHILSNGYQYIATGHYVRSSKIGEYRFIEKGVDQAKDQSFFLWNLDQKYLSRLITPLGDYHKSEIRQIALENGYKYLVEKPESMGVCFLRGEDYRDFIEKISLCKPKGFGEIVNKRGDVIGKHSGVQNYTIGQKKGLQNVPKDYCVTDIDAENNKIQVGLWSSLYFNRLFVEKCNFPSLQKGKYDDLQVMIRGFGKNPNGKCILTIDDKNQASIALEEPAWAPMAGQPAVLYKNNLLLGGGYIKSFLMQ